MSDAAWLKKLPMDVVKRFAKELNVEANLIAAICQQESSCNPFAQRYEPNFQWTLTPAVFARVIGCSPETEMHGQKNSYGMMQIMGTVARENNFRGWFGELFEAELNIEIGTRHLSKFVAKHNDIAIAISAYNCGTPKRLPNGNLANQKYVESVLKWKAEADARNGQ